MNKTQQDRQPQQPTDELGETHISWCECDECETWALALLDWESRNPNHPDNPNSVR